MNGKLLDGKCKLIKRYWQIAISMEAVQEKKKKKKKEAAMHPKKNRRGGRWGPFPDCKEKKIIVRYCTKHFPLLKWAQGES